MSQVTAATCSSPRIRPAALSPVDAVLDQLTVALNRHRAARQGAALEVPWSYGSPPPEFGWQALNQPRFRAITAAAENDPYVTSGAAKAWFSSAFSRLKASVSTRSLSHRIRSRMLSLSQEPPSPTLADTKSLSAPPKRTGILVV